MTPDTNTIHHITVVGAGLMGHGIALDFALAGYEVGLQDVDPQKLAQATARIQATLQLLAAAGFIAPDAISAVGARVRAVTDLPSAAAQADLVIESVFEDLELKRKVLAELNKCCPARTILASNTSSFSPTLLAAGIGRADKVIVAHYFNPPYLLPLVEVVKGEATSEATVSTVCALLANAGKKPVLLKKEAPGFIANRLQAAVVREALALVDSGVADPEQVDAVLRHGLGRRWAVAGVFESLDLAGLDLALTVANELLPDLASSGHVPASLTRKVEQKELGAKTGRGFYPWTAESAGARGRAIAQGLAAIARLSSAPKS